MSHTFHIAEETEAGISLWVLGQSGLQNVTLYQKPNKNKNNKTNHEEEGGGSKFN